MSSNLSLFNLKRFKQAMIIQTFTQIFAVIASANEDKYAYLMFSLPYEHIHMKWSV